MARRTYITLIIVSAIIGSLIAIWRFSSYIQNRPKPIEEVFPDGTIRIGVDASFPPFAVDDGTGLYGIDIDLGNAVGDYLGLDVQFTNMGFDGLYDSLRNGQVDILISALNFDPSKTNDVLYTRGYFDNGLLLVSNQGSDIQYIRDLAEQTLALEYGSFAHSHADYWLRRSEQFSIRPYELPDIALDAVRLNEADAAFINTTSWLLYQANYPDWQAETSRVSNAFYLIAIRRDRPHTHRWVDHALAELGTAGVIDAIIAKWFNRSDE